MIELILILFGVSQILLVLMGWILYSYTRDQGKVMDEYYKAIQKEIGGKIK
jgi:hypothetical protein